MHIREWLFETISVKVNILSLASILSNNLQGFCLFVCFGVFFCFCLVVVFLKVFIFCYEEEPCSAQNLAQIYNTEAAIFNSIVHILCQEMVTF